MGALYVALLKMKLEEKFLNAINEMIMIELIIFNITQEF